MSEPDLTAKRYETKQQNLATLPGNPKPKAGRIFNADQFDGGVCPLNAPVRAYSFIRQNERALGYPARSVTPGYVFKTPTNLCPVRIRTQVFLCLMQQMSNGISTRRRCGLKIIFHV
jgi:hypothetical protein